MTIGNALAFIDRGRSDHTLRRRIYGVSNATELQYVLESENLVFTYPEFDEAFHSRLVQCQFEEDAEQLKEFKQWWDMMYAYMGSPGTCPSNCRGCSG
jgi:hypothetical protein